MPTPDDHLAGYFPLSKEQAYEQFMRVCFPDALALEDAQKEAERLRVEAENAQLEAAAATAAATHTDYPLLAQLPIPSYESLFVEESEEDDAIDGSYPDALASSAEIASRLSAMAPPLPALSSGTSSPTLSDVSEDGLRKLNNANFRFVKHDENIRQSQGEELRYVCNLLQHFGDPSDDDTIRKIGLKIRAFCANHSRSLYSKYHQDNPDFPRTIFYFRKSHPACVFMTKAGMQLMQRQGLIINVAKFNENVNAFTVMAYGREAKSMNQQGPAGSLGVKRVESRSTSKPRGSRRLTRAALNDALANGQVNKVVSKGVTSAAASIAAPQPSRDGFFATRRTLSNGSRRSTLVDVSNSPMHQESVARNCEL